ncbi:hypothetical protein ACVWZM_008660 [Bradyrhizobium sp. USDA 4501]
MTATGGSAAEVTAGMVAGGGFGSRRFRFGPARGRQRLHEAGAVDLLEVQHKPRRLAVGGVEHVGIRDLHRSGQVEHDPRAAGHHEAIAERLHQAPPRRAGAGRELKIDLRDIDHDAVGVSQREGAKFDLAVEVEDESGLLGVAGEPGAGCDREIRGARGRRRRAVLRALSGARGAGNGKHRCCGAK